MSPLTVDPIDSPALPTRRELLQRSSLLAGALVLGSWSVASPAGAATAVSAGVGLSDARRSTYLSLAESFVTAPGMRLPPSASEQVLGDFESIYSAWPASEQRHADAVLDTLARDARMKNGLQRREMLRGSNPRDAELAYRAHSLVAVALASEPNDHAEVTV